MAGLPNIMMSAQQAPKILLNAQLHAQEKINRELFVGNTPPGTSELLLLHFLNSAMRRVQLCLPNETPILNCRVNTKFAFIELCNSDMATTALNLNGIPFLTAILKISRPSKYIEPKIPNHSIKIQTWQELTGQTLPYGTILDIEQEKVNREIFIGNTTPEMTESMIRTFLGDAMEQVGLNVMVGNPITTCRVSGKFAFIELRTPQEAANALNLNNIPFMGTQLRVGRPSKWNGPPDNHGNWEDILAKYMSGELQLGLTGPPGSTTAGGVVVPPVPGMGGGMMQQQQLLLPPGMTTPTMTPTSPPTRVVELKNMLTNDDLINEEEYIEIYEDTKEECSQFGKLLNIVIPKINEVGATRIFLEYSTIHDSQKAISCLQGRTFDGRKVQASHFNEMKFANKEF